MARSVILNNTPKAAGTYPFGPLAIPGALTQVRVDVDMTASLTGDDVLWMAEYSFDGGTTWPVTMRGGFRGGTPQRLDGGPISATLLSEEAVTLPTGTNRLARGSVTITGSTRKLPIGVTLV